MRKQKRWTSEEQIQKEIDSLHNEKRVKIDRCVQIEAENKALKRTRLKLVTIQDNERSLRRMEKRVRTIENASLPRMKRLLSAFQTKIMPEIAGEDRAVV